jgi:hypothetical protein
MKKKTNEEFQLSFVSVSEALSMPENGVDENLKKRHHINE